MKMTAVIVVAQPERRCIHVATDAAIYQADGDVTAFSTKVTTIPHFPAIITSLGNAASHVLFGNALGKRYASFDEMIQYAESELPGMHASFNLPNGADVVIAGISEARGAEAYLFRTEDVVPPMNSREEMEASELYDIPFKFVKLPNVVESPVCPPEMSIAAGYEGIDPNADEACVIWSIRKLMTMQRHIALPPGISIGGFAQVATVTAEGITQRIIERWSADMLGNATQPAPISWDVWHQQNPRPKAHVTPLRAVRAVR